MWRTVGKRNRTDVLARAFNDWLFDDVELEDLDPGCRWIFNAANLTTGARFGFERDVVGDYVVGLALTAGTGLQVAQAVAASAAVPGAFAAMRIDQVKFPCAARGVPHLLDGGTYDNTGLEALDSPRYHDVFTISLNAGGVFVTGGYGKVPFVRESGASELDAVPPEHLIADQVDGRPVRGLRSNPCRPITCTRGRVAGCSSGWLPRSPARNAPTPPSSKRSPPGSRNTEPSRRMASNKTCRSCRPCSTSSNQVWSPRWCTGAGG